MKCQISGCIKNMACQGLCLGHWHAWRESREHGRYYYWLAHKRPAASDTAFMDFVNRVESEARNAGNGGEK